MSFQDAKNFFNVKIEEEKKERKLYARKGGKPSLELIPNWNSIDHNKLYGIDQAQLTLADVEVNRDGDYNSKLFFININDKVESIIFTIYPEEVANDGKIIRARMYFNKLNGEFFDGYRIENGKITKRIVLKKGVNVQKAGLFMFFQSKEDCWNTDNLPDAGTLEEVNLGTVSSSGGGGGGSAVHLNISSVNWYYLGNGNSAGLNYSGGGGGTSVTSGAGTLYLQTKKAADNEESDPNRDPATGKCKYGCKMNPNTGKCEKVDTDCTNGKVYNDTIKKCECPEGTEEDSNGNCVSIPTPCETALLSRDVYNTTNGQVKLGEEPIPTELRGGWELNTTLDVSTMTLTQDSSGFNSAIYQKLVNGVYQYMYITEGTEPSSFVDWYNNFSQISGNSSQYDLSVQNAKKLHDLVGNKQLYFSGHSLGGGLASVNSLATGRTAFTYNAAGLSNDTRNLYNNGLNPQINATVVKGEIVDKIQSEFGIHAKDSDTINYIEEESTYWQDFFNERSPALNTYKAVRLHAIDAIIDILDCE